MITEVTQAEVDDVVALARAYYIEIATIEPWVECSDQWDAGYHQVVHHAVSSDDYGYLLGRLKGNPVGFCAWFTSKEPLFHAADRGMIADLFVAPEARRLGLGRKLAAAAMREIEARGVPRSAIQVNVLNADVTAMDFWQSLGFSEFMVRMRCEETSD